MIRKLCSCLIIFTALLSPMLLHAGDDCDLAPEAMNRGLKTFEKDKKKGLSYLLQALDYCPDSKVAKYNVGLAYYKYPQKNKAYVIWSELAEKSPKDAKLLSNLGWLALELGKAGDAESWAVKLISADSSDKNGPALMLQALNGKKDYDRALAFVMENRSFFSREQQDEVVKQAVDERWDIFHGGKPKRAARSIKSLSKKYPQVAAISKAKESILDALITGSSTYDDDYAQRGGGNSFVPQPVKADVDVLDIAGLKQSMNPTPKAFALIVGINDYENVNDLRFAENDALNMSGVLSRRAGFKLDTNHIHLLRNKEATIGKMYRELAWLKDKAVRNPDAKIIFYFSGHGAPLLGDNGGIKDGALLPYDVGDYVSERTALPLSYIKNSLTNDKNKNILIVVDACFSGKGKSVSRKKAMFPTVNTSLIAGKNLFITASAANKAADEFEPGRQGAFSYFFMKALIGEGDSNKDGWVDTVEAYEYAKDMLDSLGMDQSPEMSAPRRMKLTKVN